MSNAPDMSIWHLISHASLIVQFVLLVLIAASVYSWTIIFQRHALYKTATDHADKFDEQFWSGGDLHAFYTQLNRQPDLQGQENIFRSGFKEFLRLREKGADPDAVMQGLSRAMRIALTQEQTRLETSLSFLASVGSTSPYIGLFGTVWGIMTSFIGLAKMQQATLAVVAPGIAEALIATAMGLFAAIPAVLAYNRFASTSDTLLTRYESFADEFTGILHRETHARQ
ncbi:MAG: protein TolQ [bacterium]|jgi:biopolymer transport protein TolQ|nr:protein TolQ [bacterium]